jgi:hypothetical protein
VSAEVFILVHSPLVGPVTWALVADELRRTGAEAVIPVLEDVEGATEPNWKQHAMSAARTLASIPADRALALVAHSGAGPLLPAIRQVSHRPVVAYLFVDAGIPKDGASRLDLMGEESPDFAMRFRRALASGERFPAWSDADLAEVIPDAERRRHLLAELRPRPLAFFEEPIPVFPGWPDAPCGYLKFSLVYEPYAALARQNGWVCRELPAGHFHMLVDPPEVARALLDLRQDVM